MIGRGRMLAAVVVGGCCLAGACGCSANASQDAGTPTTGTRAVPVERAVAGGFALVADGVDSHPSLRLVPGEHGTIGLRVTNPADAPRGFRFGADGRAGEWVRVPAPVSVPPRQSVALPVEIRAPAAAQPGRTSVRVWAQEQTTSSSGDAMPVVYRAAVPVTLVVAPGP